MLKWIFRPAGAGRGAGGPGRRHARWIVFQSGDRGSAKPQRPLRPSCAGEQEVAFLYPATNNAGVGAVRPRRVERLPATACRRCYPGLEGADHRDLMRRGRLQAVPGRIPRRGSCVTRRVQLLGGTSENDCRLVFRWYKLTSDWSPPPGSRHCSPGSRRRWPSSAATTVTGAASWPASWPARPRSLPEADRPLLLLTTATADKVPRPDWIPPRLLPGRTSPKTASRWGEAHGGSERHLRRPDLPLLLHQPPDGHRRHPASSGAGRNCAPTSTRPSSGSGPTTPIRKDLVDGYRVGAGPPRGRHPVAAMGRSSAAASAWACIRGPWPAGFTSRVFSIPPTGDLPVAHRFQRRQLRRPQPLRGKGGPGLLSAQGRQQQSRQVFPARRVDRPARAGRCSLSPARRRRGAFLREPGVS